MKKILLIFGSFSVVPTTAFNCISCGNDDPENRENIVKEIDTYNIGNIDKLDDSLVIDAFLKSNPKINASHKEEIECNIIDFKTAYIFDYWDRAYLFNGFYVNFNWKLSNPYEDKNNSITKIELNKDATSLKLSFDISTDNYDLMTDGKLEIVVDNLDYQNYVVPDSDIKHEIDLINKKYNLIFTWTNNNDPRKEGTNFFIRYKTKSKIIYIQEFEISNI